MSIRKNFTPIASIALLLLVMLPGSGISSNNIKSTTGFIAAVGIEMDEQGHPRLAEYDSEGRFVADVGYLAVDIPEDAILYPAASWRAFEQFHQNLIASNPEATSGARLLSVEQYDKQSYTTRGAALPVSKPGLLPGTKSVFVIAEDRMLNANPGKEGFILAEYPVDLRQMGSVAADDVTLILNSQGEILRSSKFDISFKAAVYREDGRSKNTAEERIWQPIPNVNVEVDVFGGYGTSGPDGRYQVTYAMPPCPGFSYNLDIPIVATLYFDNFNPKNKDDSENQGFLSAIRYDNKSCVGYGFGAIATTLSGQLAQLNAQAATSLISTPIYNFDLTFSTMLLNAVGTMPGVKLADETVYTADNSQIADLAEYNFDFNLDGLPDTAVPNPDDSSKIDIYYSPKPVTNELGERNPPDFTRVADKDFNSQLAHQGLLSEISREDLENTDIYIYRRSTGQRLGSIEGLLTKTADDGIVRGGTLNEGRATYRGVHEDKEFATFGFTSYLTGAVSSDWWSNLNNYSLKDKTNRRPWLPSESKAAGFTTDNPPDSLRPGEVIQIIAINRATGYIGTQDIITQPSGTPLEPPAPIQMFPPNLKIIASREFEDFNELSESTDKKINIIGSEGAGLTSDTYVKIQTVWLTQSGDVLPDDLPGYTGRLAISTGSATEDFSGNFEIRPGYQTQVVQLNNAADLTKEHFYVQVVGEHIDGNPKFESPGAGAGKLQTRPRKYVPILVPLFDEASTRVAEEALAIARLEGIANLAERAEPTYRWVYRPEMQFSVFELSKQELFYQDQELNTQSIDLTQEHASEIVGAILSGDLDFVDLLYNLNGPATDALAPIGPDREITFTIGAEEAVATVSAGGVVRFDDLAHLKLLGVDDYLAISLYQNNDSNNVLWEFAFELMRLVADMNHDGQIVRRVTEDGQIADATDTKDFPFLFWINDDDDDGEINEGKGAGGDIPKDNSPDHRNNKVDGMRDLVDFFPVFVSVKATLDAFPASDYTYRLLHAGDAFKFLEADGLVPVSNDISKGVYAPIKNVETAQRLAEEELHLITEAGVNLSPTFLNAIKNDEGGIILLEAVKDTKDPLFLEIVEKSSNKVMTSARLEVMIGDVEKMFRRVDLKDKAIDREYSNSNKFVASTGDPEYNPDARTEPNYLVWVHGYNVSPDNARGWTSEMFKRFYRMGFNGRFIGVNWNGATGVDYHAAIYNALQSSRTLAAKLAPAMPDQGPITIAGHSAGNMVAASAIAYGGLSVDRYFAINSVVPIEAFNRTQTDGQDRDGNPVLMAPKMRHKDWKDYPDELLTWDWYKLFDYPNDDRSRITWADYFKTITNVTYNFYSPGEEVVENARDNESVSSGVFTTVGNWAQGGSLGEHAWVVQEIGKGCNGLIAWTLFECSGGWSFNNNPDDLEFIGEEISSPNGNRYQRYGTASEAANARTNGEITTDELAQYGFFRRFSHFDNNKEESEYRYLYAPINTTVKFQQASHQWDLLTSAVPSRSFATAANPVDAFDDTGTGGIDRNFNMEALRGDNWPQERTIEIFGDRWLHSDVKNIAMPYLYPIYEIMLEEGKFIDEN